MRKNWKNIFKEIVMTTVIRYSCCVPVPGSVRLEIKKKWNFVDCILRVLWSNNCLVEFEFLYNFYGKYANKHESNVLKTKIKTKMSTNDLSFQQKEKFYILFLLPRKCITCQQIKLKIAISFHVLIIWYMYIQFD